MKPHQQAATGSIAIGLLIGGLFHLSPALGQDAKLVGLLISAALFGGGVYVLSSGKQGLLLTRMVLLVLLPLACIGILLVIAALHFVPLNAAGTASRISPALLAGIAVSLGWIAGPLTQELRRSDEREERRRDMIEASANEIWLIAKFAANLNVETVLEEFRRSFARDNSYKVFVLFRREFSTLKRLVEQIEILRKDQIDPVMSFFQLIARLDQIEERMNSDEFHKLPRPRREAAVRLYYRIFATIPAESLIILKALDRPEYASKLEKLIAEKKTKFATQLTKAGNAND